MHSPSREQSGGENRAEIRVREHPLTRPPPLRAKTRERGGKVKGFEQGEEERAHSLLLEIPSSNLYLTFETDAAINSKWG